MNAKSPPVPMLLIVGALGLLGCRASERAAVPDVPGTFEPSSLDGAVRDEPSHEVRLESGERIAFFADEDGSVGVLSEVPIDGGAGPSLDDLRLREASPAMIYFAVTAEGSEIPAELVAHHEDLAREGEWPPLAEALAGLERGWFLGSPASAALPPCQNVIFIIRHCSHPAYDEAFCKLNTGGTWSWQVPGADRYKAGFCLQQNQAHSWLYYLTQAGGCNYFQSPHFIWGFDSAVLGQPYSATTYRSYVWWRASGAPHRQFFHFGGDAQGDVFDWGQRYSWDSCP